MSRPLFFAAATRVDAMSMCAGLPAARLLGPGRRRRLPHRRIDRVPVSFASGPGLSRPSSSISTPKWDRKIDRVRGRLQLGR